MPESQAKLKLRCGRIIAILKQTYPQVKCSLDFRNPMELLAATILSAQCTDARVNIVTPGLFKKYPDAQAFAGCDLEELEQEIRSTGFYHNKAKAIRGSAEMIVKDFGGRVPANMPDLLKLPGVARKTANVILGNAFGLNEGIAVDTHVIRLSGRLKLTKSDKPDKIEQGLMVIVPRDDWSLLTHLMIYHGRAICTARKPACADCRISKLCPSAFKV
jgi:endonuclease-3